MLYRGLRELRGRVLLAQRDVADREDPVASLDPKQCVNVDMRSFDSLSEREILALAISSEEEDEKRPNKKSKKSSKSPPKTDGPTESAADTAWNVARAAASG